MCIRDRGKIPPGSQNGTLTQHYENNHHHHHHLEFGYVAPEDIRKAKGGSAPGEYQEPFVDPQFSSFMVASNGFVGQSSSGNSNNGSNGKGKMTEYYSCTLVSNPLAIGNKKGTI